MRWTPSVRLVGVGPFEGKCCTFLSPFFFLGTTLVNVIPPDPLDPVYFASVEESSHDSSVLWIVLPCHRLFVENISVVQLRPTLQSEEYVYKP